MPNRKQNPKVRNGVLSGWRIPPPLPRNLEILIIYISATKQATTDWYLLVNSLLQDSEDIGAYTR